MSYQTIGVAAKDPNFQARCRGAVISIGAVIINAAQDSHALVNNAGEDLTTLACKNLAKNYCKGKHEFTDQALASLMLLNYEVAANPASTDDDPVQYQTKEIWLSLVEIG